MNLPLALLIIAVIVGMTIYIFQHAMRKSDLSKDGASPYQGCASCAASEYCNHISSLEHFAEQCDQKRKEKK